MLFTSISHHLQTQTGFWVNLCTLISLIIAIYNVYLYQLNNDYYILYKIYTKACIIVYISIFIIVILTLRIYTWGILRDTRVIANKLISYWNTSYIVSLIFLCIIILFMLLLHRLKQYLTKQVMKQYLYTLYSPDGLYMPFNENHYKLWWRKLYILYEQSYDNYLYNPCNLWLNRLYVKLQDPADRSYRKIIIRFILEHREIIFTVIPISIIPCLFLYDYYMYNGIIIKVFYYLPFYFIYILWKSSTSFLQYTDWGFNGIIYERYYLDNVAYINITPEEEAIFTKYLTSGLILHNISLLDFTRGFQY